MAVVWSVGEKLLGARTTYLVHLGVDGCVGRAEDTAGGNWAIEVGHLATRPSHRLCSKTQYYVLQGFSEA